MRRQLAIAVVIAVLIIGGMLIGGTVVWRWIQVLPYPMGGGQYQASPNGRYEAHAFDMHDEDFWGNERDYYELYVLEKASGKRIRRIRMDPIPGEPVFFMRRKQHVIAWAEDSKSVTFSFQGIELKIHVWRTTAN